jgi:hypothetical protein
VEIRNCDITCGDDAIVVKTTRQTNDYGPSANIVVRDCVLKTQDSGLKIGTETTSDIRDYAIQVSDDGNQWREITQGQLASTFDPQQIRFPQTITAKQLKLTALSGFGNDSTASLAELAVIYAGPKIADKSSGTVEYQRVRTASPDIDAGTDVSNKPPKPSK